MKAFKEIKEGDGEDIQNLLRVIELRDPDNFLRSHATALLLLKPLHLKRSIKRMLPESG